MIHPLINLETMRGLPLAWFCAVAIAIQLLAIIYFVEKLKSVDLGEAKTIAHWRDKIVQERRHRAAYGLIIDLSLYILAAEIVVTFIALTR